MSACRVDWGSDQVSGGTIVAHIKTSHEPEENNKLDFSNASGENKLCAHLPLGYCVTPQPILFVAAQASWVKCPVEGEKAKEEMLGMGSSSISLNQESIAPTQSVLSMVLVVNA